MCTRNWLRLFCDGFQIIRDGPVVREFSFLIINIARYGGEMGERVEVCEFWCVHGARGFFNHMWKCAYLGVMEVSVYFGTLQRL